MNNELIKKMEKIAKAMNVIYGGIGNKLVAYDTKMDIETITQDEPLKNVYIWAIRRSGTALLKLCKENKDDIQIVVANQSNIAFFSIENGELTPISRFNAILMAATI